jgi:hypothetical protein
MQWSGRREGKKLLVCHPPSPMPEIGDRLENAILDLSDF